MIDRNVPSIGALIERRYSRRDALRGSASAIAATAVGGSLLAACSGDNNNATPTPTGPTVTATVAPASTTAGSVVTVTATATAAGGGSVANTSFVQVSGPAVTLSSVTGLTTSFIAPAVAATTIIAVRFTATDASGGQGTTDINVSIAPAVLSFAATPKTKADIVTAPAGYAVSVIAATGTPIAAATPAYANDGTDGDFGNRIGDHGAGSLYFGLVSSGTGIDVANSTRGVLATNHESVTQAYLHPAGPTAPGGNRPEAEAAKEMAAVGISVTEIARAATGAWGVVQASDYNRRVTATTAVAFNGPVRGNALLHTAFSADGTAGRGTVGNGAIGRSGWGTVLSSEEKWAPLFRRPAAADDARRSTKERAALARYGVNDATGQFGWASVTPADASSTVYRRWDVQATGGAATADFRNEPNQFGWVVEADPYSKAASVRKRTALGRLAHSGVTTSVFVVGAKPVVYMGDAGENEYLYKFVSNTVWASADAAAADRMAIGDKYLDTGTLYVAKFAADGTGTWVPLTFGTAPLDGSYAPYPFADQADVLTHARLAGDALGATPMDRPAWTAVNPASGQLFVALNGSNVRTPANTNAANPRAYVDPPSPAVGNRNGHIIRLAEATADATAFSWDIHLLGAGADLDATNINVSALDATNDFSGPEGLRFAPQSNPAGLGTPLMWIQTEDTAYTDVTNAMLLANFPTSVGNSDAKTITNGGATQATKIGKTPAALLKRFLVGPVEAAITGVDSTPDGRTLFVNVQHPGASGTAAAPTSNWPANQAGAAPVSRPRSATIVITRTDGGIVGL